MLDQRVRSVCCAAVIVLVDFIAPGYAEPGHANDSDNKFAIELGAIENYISETAAAAACSPDGVVWADRKTGYFYPRFAKEYGTSPYGAFTCFKAALKADYWGFGVSTDVGAKKGRVFPEFFPCNLCM